MRTIRSKKSPRRAKRRNRPLNRLVENDLIRQVSIEEYQEKVRKVYGGPKGQETGRIKKPLNLGRRRLYKANNEAIIA